jgi:hypothetical protein
MKLIDTGRSRHGWSTIGSLSYCAQKYAYEQESRRDGVEIVFSATERGSIVHAGVGHHYIQRVAGINAADWYTPMDAMSACAEGQHMQETDPEKLTYLQEVVTKYIEVYADLDERYEILAVEHEFAARFDGEEITYKADLVWRTPDGRIQFVDHKSTSSTLTGIEDRYQLSGQMLLAQLIGRKKYGAAFGGIVINAIRCNQKIVNHQFARADLPVAHGALRTFADDIRGLLRRRDELRGRDVNCYPKAANELVCRTPYGPCPFTQKCMQGE